MFISTKGFVLRSHPFKDGKFISKVFTRETGLTSFICKKTKNHIILSQPLTMLDITYRAPKNKQLFYVADTHINYVYQSLLFNNSKMSHSIILCEILSKCLSEPNIQLFDFIINSFKWLDTCSIHPPIFNNFFLIKFCEKIGISPFNEPWDAFPKNYVLNISEGAFMQNNSSISNQHLVPHAESAKIYNLSKMSFEELLNYEISKNMNASIFSYLIKYISTHLTEISNLKSTSIINEMY